jgi:hypothetical protein
MMQNMKRRDYYKGAALNKDGTELRMSDWLGEPPEIDPADIAQTINVDVIVVGGGTAGVAATRGAAEEGATVALFEKTKSVQARSGEFGVVGFSKVLNDKYGMDFSKYNEKIIQEFMKQCTFRNSHRLLKKWIDNCGAAFDWYCEGAPDMFMCDTSISPVPTDVKFWLQPTRWPQPEGFEPLDEYYPLFPGTVRFSPSHLPVLKGNLEIAEKTGRVQTFFRTRVVKLLREDGGRVTGVIAQRYEDDKYIQANCAKGVILTTGGYGGNADMLDYYIPWAKDEFSMPTSIDEKGVPGNCGDGVRLGLHIGAKVEDGPHAMIDHAMGGCLLGCTPYLCLDDDGERFMNEEVTGQQWGAQINRLHGIRAYQIFDSKWPEQIKSMPCGHATVIDLIPDDSAFTNGLQAYDANDSYISIETFNKKLHDPKARRGAFCVEAATIDELIAALPISDAAKKTAKKSIERYNELCRKGKDEDFFKTASRMFPIESGPFYACELGNGAILDAIGGLDSDHECRVRDDDRTIIPGLYAAGNCQGNRFKTDYPMVVPGISHSSCITFGRMAGINCVRGV